VTLLGFLKKICSAVYFYFLLQTPDPMSTIEFYFLSKKPSSSRIGPVFATTVGYNICLTKKRMTPSERKRKRKKPKPMSLAICDATTTSTKQPANAGEGLVANSHVSASLPFGRKFVTSQDTGFSEHVQEHYQGFVHLPVTEYEARWNQRDFHQNARRALERLRDAGYYQYDIVMAGGKHSSRTFVKRTLVGEPGITYKYLGVRLFAHAWSGPLASPALKDIGEMNRRMVQITKQMPNPGLCDYNLTLINYMEPTSHTSVGFKEEASYGMGKVSVSWHADSSLESGSAIGVYHCFPTQRAAKWDWRIALRPSPDDNNDKKATNNSSTIAPVVVNTKDGDMYFLLGDFNEKYQHCVLAGSQANRISSTHRVAVTAEDTYDYILKRSKIARKRFRLQLHENEETFHLSSPTRLDAKIMRYCQRVLTEVEMEWIAQYWLQGAEHDKMHVWWQRPMKTLEAYQAAMEEYTYQLYQLCVDKSTSNKVPLDVLKVLLTELKVRQELRVQWHERRSDKIYQRRIAVDYRPVARPLFPSNEHESAKKIERLPKDLTSAIEHLSQVLKKRTSQSQDVLGATAIRIQQSRMEPLQKVASANNQGNMTIKRRLVDINSKKGKEKNKKRKLR
jgi:mRNA N6-methyladenine demethylase